jgi:AraC-like DNA-binding protein/mannose-6-phosphate isomerase-like protein (cupin superfamily)
MFKHYHIGHFINEPQNPTQFEILEFETMQEPNVDDWHKHTFYEILWVEKGKTFQYIDYKKYEINDNTLFFISPNQLHYFETWSELEGLTILFTEEFFLLNQQNQDILFEISFLDNFYSNPFLHLDSQSASDLKNIIEQIKNEKKHAQSSKIILQSFLHILLAKIQRYINQNQSVSPSKKYLITFKKFKNLLDEHFQQGFSVSDYAEKLSITQHHLNLICNEIAGKTASQVIRSRVILEAKRMLTFSESTINEISYQLGFEENAYFSRVFKKETGISPIEFKQKELKHIHSKN